MFPTPFLPTVSFFTWSLFGWYEQRPDCRHWHLPARKLRTCEWPYEELTSCCESSMLTSPFFSGSGVRDLIFLTHIQEYAYLLFQGLLLSHPIDTVSVQAQLQAQLMALPSHTCKSRVTWMLVSSAVLCEEGAFGPWARPDRLSLRHTHKIYFHWGHHPSVDL